MKTLLAVAALSLSATVAFAAEGNGNPFPFQAAPQVVPLDHYKQAAGANQNPFPFTAPGTPMVQGQVLPTNGAAGEVQTVNSLPRGFENGTPSAIGSDVPAMTRLAQPHAIRTGGPG